VFTAVASSHSERVDRWLDTWTVRTPRALSGRRVDPSFGCACAERDRGGMAFSTYGVLIGTMRVEPIPTSRAERAELDADRSPLEAALRMLQDRGPSAFRDLVGRFALVLWNRTTRELLAARDPLGLDPLYYAEAAGALLLASSLDAFADHGRFDDEYIARFITGRGNPDTTRTIRNGVRALPPGTWLRWQNGRVTTETYWSPENLSPLKMSLADASSEFRALLQRALKAQIDPGGRTWAHLSGGLDSSTVVAAAAAAVESGAADTALGGTLTLRDSLGNADESEFVDEVVQRYGVTNVAIADSWPWRSDDLGPPLTDRPSRDYPFYARDREMARAVTSTGGTSMLSGIGPDIYLPNTAAHCPDLLWGGHVAAAVRELHAWTVSKRGSFWRVVITDGVRPLTSRTHSAARNYGPSRIPRWFTPRFRQQRGIAELLAEERRYAGPRGRYYTHHVAAGLSSVAARISNWLYSPGVDVRHPLLHQPLVEFCLRLPYPLRTDVYWSKPVLRTAMKGILPEKVRTRGSKTILAPRIYWAFRHEREQLQRLLNHSVLADLGCIEPREVRQTLESFDLYGNGEASFLYALLSLETWLSVKSGRWIVDGRTSEEEEHGYDTHRTYKQRDTLTSSAQVYQTERS
jgi:asparagine synthase (glutamine-hydrolysing)